MNLGLFFFFFSLFLSLSFPPLTIPQTDSLFHYETVGSLYARMWNVYNTDILITASYISELTKRICHESRFLLFNQAYKASRTIFYAGFHWVF